MISVCFSAFSLQRIEKDYEQLKQDGPVTKSENEKLRRVNILSYDSWLDLESDKNLAIKLFVINFKYFKRGKLGLTRNTCLYQPGILSLKI